MQLACCGGERKQPLVMTTTERLLAGSLREEERLRAAAPALAFWDLRPPAVGEAEPFGEPRRYELSAAFLVEHDASRGPGGRGAEVALLGLRVGWLSQDLAVALPFCAGAPRILPAFAESEAEDLRAAEAEKARFCLVLPGAVEGTEAAAEQQALLAALTALEAARGQNSWRAARGFPCATGAFDWLWSYAPLASFLPGLEQPPQVAEPGGVVAPPPAAPPGGGPPALSVVTVSLNCGGRPPPLPSELLPLFAELAPPEGAPGAAAGLVVAALQEVCPLYLAFYPSLLAGSADSDAAEAWTAALCAALAEAAAGAPGAPCYERAFSLSLVGLVLVVWARADVAALLEEPPAGGVARCGAYGAGNKGAVAASLRLGGRRLCVADVHLAAGRGAARAEARLRDLEEILWQLSFGRGPARRSALEHDLLLVAGDFNFRLGGAGGCEEPPSPEAAREALAGAAPGELAARMEAQGDEGVRLQRAGRGAWALLREAPIDFPPTYKFQPGEDAFAPGAAPAWCDRVLWWARPARFAAAPRPAGYGRVDGVRCSDHRPVRLALELTLVPEPDAAADPAEGNGAMPRRLRKLSTCRQQ